MKRRVWAAASAVMMATTAFGAQAVLADKYPNGQVKVFNWGEYIDEDLIDEFEDEYGIEVIYDTFDTNEAMYPRVEADPSLYDVICPSDYMIEKMIQNDVLDSAKLEGKIEGKIEGRLEGRAEGREEGREEGIKEGVLRNARRMKEKGFSTEDIMEITGLTFEEVSQL